VIGALLEIPLAIPSFVFHRVMRVVMRRLVVINSRRKGRLGYAWGVVSGRTLSQPLALPAVMTTAPRWNTHAIIGGAGPITVKSAVAVDVETLQKNAGAWTAAFYAFPKQTTAALVGSVDGPFAERWRTLALPPGEYTLVFRLYHTGQHLELPEVRIDGGDGIPHAVVDAHANDFYADLPARRSLFYLCLHFYIGTLLRLGAPAWLVERELLPMGNPETQFKYGAVAKGESLRVTLPAALLADQDVYFTRYTRDSFPAAWYQLTEPEHRTAPAEESGFYLLRVHRRHAGAAKAELAALRIEPV
jgi:hypothetical protein